MPGTPMRPGNFSTEQPACREPCSMRGPARVSVPAFRDVPCGQRGLWLWATEGCETRCANLDQLQGVFHLSGVRAGATSRGGQDMWEPIATA